MTPMQMNELAAKVEGNPDLEQRMKQDPAGTLKTLGAMPLATDLLIYRVIVGGMVFLMITAALGAMVLTAYDKKVPDSVIALGSAALGAVAILLRPQGQS